MSRLRVYLGNNYQVLAKLKTGFYDLCYIDPPFNTGNQQVGVFTTVKRAKNGLTGFGGFKYKRASTTLSSYSDSFDDYLGWLVPRLEEAYRLLKPNGSLFVHLDWREVHYVKVALDELFGRASFKNEIIWAYDYGARSKSKWSAKHNTLLWYAKNPDDYTFNFDAIDRIPYLAPNLVGAEKAAIGKTPTTVWWNTIVSPTGRERTGYPTQKPLSILSRIVRVHSNKGDRLLDFFAGSGSFGEAAVMHGRSCTLIDSNPQALMVMKKRFAKYRHSTSIEYR